MKRPTPPGAEDIQLTPRLRLTAAPPLRDTRGRILSAAQAAAENRNIAEQAETRRLIAAAQLLPSRVSITQPALRPNRDSKGKTI